jgi:predicted transcriptional regulator of viral defense system
MFVAGKNIGRLGVETLRNANGENPEVTNLERTLIDITVRPAYAGGIGEVLKAYRAARDRASVDRLMSILDEVSYVYPYHQAVGFLMETAGYGVSDTFTARQPKLDFYFAYGMKDPSYSKTWRLFYPHDLQIPE